MAKIISIAIPFAAVLAAAAPAAAHPDPADEAGGYDNPPIPPHVEGQAMAAPGGGFCYVGQHPTDPRVDPGGSFHDANGPHTHFYAPIDLRLFSYRDGCYYFIGDPRDFGYAGSTYSYYGAHPVLDTYGGGWCFMMGGHYHLWRPWSAYFTVVGPWFYWQGAYDPFFWSYWPYYSFYYRSYYGHYYGGGRFHRSRNFHVAPPIRRVPPTAAPSGSSWRGRPPGTVTAPSPGGLRGAPVGGGGYVGGPSYRGVPGSAVPPRAAAPFRASPPSRGWSSPSNSTAIPFRAAPSGGRSGGPSGGGGGGHFRGRPR